MTARYARVVASGFRRPCSHSWSVLGLMQKARANSACDIRALVRMRFTSTSSGSTIRRIGNLASPFTWARISLALCSRDMPSTVRRLVPFSDCARAWLSFYFLNMRRCRIDGSTPSCEVGDRSRRSHECERGTQECVRYIYCVGAQ